MKNYIKKFVIGTWPLSGDYGPVKTDSAIEAIDFAIKNQIIEFDTAPSYGCGKAELLIGEFSKNKIIVNTKIGNNERKIKSFKIKDLNISIEKSLKRLKRDSINVLFLHNPRISISKLDKLVYFLIQLKKEKIIKKSGISLPKNFKIPFSILNEFDVVQDDLNLLKLDQLENNFKNFHARSPLASGLLSGRRISLKRFSKKNDHRKEWLDKKRLKHLKIQISKIEKFNSKSLHRLSRKIILQQENVNKVVFGVRNKIQIKDLLKDKKFVPYTKAMQKKIFTLYIDNEYSKNHKLNY